MKQIPTEYTWWQGTSLEKVAAAMSLHVSCLQVPLLGLSCLSPQFEKWCLCLCVCVRERERTANRYCPPPTTIYSHDKCSTSILKQPWLETNPKSCQNFLSCSCAVPEAENTTCKMQNWMEIWMLTCKVLRWTAASAYSALQYQCDHATTPLQPGQEKVAR